MRIPLTGALESALSSKVTFREGELLVKRGDPADHVLVLVTGSARVESAEGVLLSELGPGDLVGELSILAGGTRSADVTAVGQVTAQRFDRAAFIQFIDANPEIGAEVAGEIARRLDEQHIASALTRLFGADADIPFDDIREHLTWRWLRTGEQLYRMGDPAEAGYLVISGRLRVIGLDDEGAEKTIGEVSPDEFVGESGVFDTRRRRVTVEAIRDTLVAEVTRQAAVALLGSHPESLGPFIALIAGGGRRSTRHARRTVALSITADVDPRVFASRLHTEMSAERSCEHVWSGWVDAKLSQPGSADAEPGSPVEARRSQLLHEIELSNDHMLLEVNREWSNWSAVAASHADRLVACTSPQPDEREAHLVDQLFEAGSPHAERVLVIVHPPDTDRPRDTAPWVERWNIDRIAHIVAGSTDDMARLGRLLTGRSIGLVFGGGGARGFAHSGVRKAMMELGIPIDMLGGSSIGGALGGVAAMNVSSEVHIEMIERLFKDLLDYTIPMVSLVKGEAISKVITEAYQEWTFEDLWRPFYCVTTNLTRSTEMVHRRGEMVRVIRASVSIPGVMPPVAWGDDLLVDGGVLNNLPADIMRGDVEDGTVIAVNVAPPTGPRAKGDTALSVSGWKALRSRVTGAKPAYPGITAMLMRTIIAGSVREQSRMLDRGDVDLYLDLDLRGVSLLDFENARPVVQAGYEAAMPQLEAWLEQRKA